ncbi:hypothetical protein EDD22DRAFT_339510 [Suillus occidentalis]|nr:hypothetical protein EDD22DRAFT_339510 [Suillus occidentalis]
MSQAIMSMRIYAMYMRSRMVLALLSISFLATARLVIAVGVTVLGPESGIFDEHLLSLRRSYRLPYIKFVLSDFHVCGPSVNTASHLHWQTISWGSASSLSCNLLLPLDASLSMRRKCERCCVGGKLTNSYKFRAR